MTLVAPATTIRQLDGVVSAVIVRRAGGLALTLQDGVWICDTDTGPLRRLAPIEARDQATRLNDAKVDPGGRLWVGSMAFNTRAGAGTLYRVDPAPVRSRRWPGSDRGSRPVRLDDLERNGVEPRRPV